MDKGRLTLITTAKIDGDISIVANSTIHHVPHMNTIWETKYPAQVAHEKRLLPANNRLPYLCFMTVHRYSLSASRSFAAVAAT